MIIALCCDLLRYYDYAFIIARILQSSLVNCCHCQNTEYRIKHADNKINTSLLMYTNILDIENIINIK